jgi:hypothetical protein
MSMKLSSCLIPPPAAFNDSHLAETLAVSSRPRSPSCACEGNAWREGNTVELPLENGELPDRCVICNAPADFYRQIVTYRVVPRATSVLMFSPLLYAVAARSTATVVTLELGLCQKHRNRRSQGRLWKGAGLILGAGLFVLGVYIRSLPLMIASTILPLVAMVIGEHMMTTAKLVNVSDGVVRLRVGNRFLASIPPRRPGSRY